MLRAPLCCRWKGQRGNGCGPGHGTVWGDGVGDGSRAPPCLVPSPSAWPLLPPPCLGDLGGEGPPRAEPPAQGGHTPSTSNTIDTAAPQNHQGNPHSIGTPMAQGPPWHRDLYGNPMAQGPHVTGTPMSQGPHGTVNPMAWGPHSTGTPTAQESPCHRDPMARGPHTQGPHAQGPPQHRDPHGTGTPTAQGPPQHKDLMAQGPHGTGRPWHGDFHGTGTPNGTGTPMAQGPHWHGDPLSGTSAGVLYNSQEIPTALEQPRCCSTGGTGGTPAQLGPHP
uniref:Uncharacterized protein n=1 Tax=Anas zonorhyncha TaxID=75864 RepID=A0A8B9V2Y0_9AVES